MVGWRAFSLALLFTLTILAGCGSKEVVTDTDTVSDVVVTATADTGIIRGIVLDEAVRPIAKVTLTVKTAEKTLSTESTESGGFGFEGLKAGTYFIVAHKKGFKDVQQSADVVAGVNDPPIVKVRLETNPTEKPYVEPHLFSGFMECGVSTPAVGVAVCLAVGSPNENTQVHIQFQANISWLQSEMIWEPSNELGTDMSLLHTYDCGGTLYCDHAARGKSPLAVIDNATWIRTLGLNNGTDLYIRVFATGREETRPPPGTCVTDPTGTLGTRCPGGVGVTVEQPFDIYTHAFHNFVPPEGYLFSKDGDPKVPPQ